MSRLFFSKDTNIEVTCLKDELLTEKAVEFSVLRLDKLHPVASGNKLFKLSLFIEEAKLNTGRLLTFGGAYSNHLAATASVCREMNLKCIGIVRGEQPAKLSHTLEFCLTMGMQIEFVSRELYSAKTNPSFINSLKDRYGEFTLVPEGGAGPQGIEGASGIAEYFPGQQYTHICCSIGTGTTIAGLHRCQEAGSKLIGFPAFKGFNNLSPDIATKLTTENIEAFELFPNYHFGGYAKYNAELLQFMNELYQTQKIPTDFVYTGKMFYGVFDLIKKNYFPFNSNILCLHTGGLQGNLSLPPDALYF